MRTWTLVVSVCAHAAVATAILVAPIFATADLPEPRRPLTFEHVTPVVPTIPIAAPPRPSSPAATPRTFPIIEPPTLPPADMPAPVAAVPEDLVARGGTGVPSDVFLPVGDPVQAPPPAPVRHDPVRVGGVIRPPTRVVYVQPVYPPVALAARKEATVILEAVIDEKGAVRELRVLRGHPLFDQEAMQAVAKWQFTPTTLNGTTVPIVMTVTVTFSLAK